MKNRILFTIALVAVAAMSLGDARAAEEREVWAPFIAAITRPAPDGGCAYVCGDCGNGHKVNSLCIAGEESCDTPDEPESTCTSSHSCNFHTDCPPEPAPVADLERVQPGLWLALRETDGETLRGFLERNRHAVSFNEKRKSLQILGCGGTLIGNIPLTDQQVSFLDP